MADVAKQSMNRQVKYDRCTVSFLLSARGEVSKAVTY